MLPGDDVNPVFTVTKESEQFIVALVKSSAAYRPVVDRAVKKIAEKCAEDVKRTILSQVFPNARLTDAWLARKAREGMDPRTLIATRKYVDSIKAARVEQGVWGVTCSDNELRLRLEYGTRRGSPPRPHWGPVLDSFSRNFYDIFAKEVIAELFPGGR